MRSLAVADDDSKLSTGRFARLAKLASMSAKLSTDVVSRGVKRFTNKDEPTSIFSAGAAEKLVATLGDLKGLAMKMGQQISMDPDLLTPEVRAVIARLQNQAPPMPYARVREVITQQLGRSPEEAYLEFSEAPLASASLGQVHLAKLHDGTRVAVKVQYPDIANALQADLENLSAMVSVVATTTRLTHGKEYFAELRESMVDELDYLQEAERAEVFRAAAAPLPDLVVPRVFASHTSHKVLTLEFLEGETFKQYLHHGAEQSNDEKLRVARLLTRAVWGPFLASGAIHADPHPGNFILMSGDRVGVLDFGAIKTLSPRWVDVNRRLFASVVNDTPMDAVRLSIDCGFQFDDPEGSREFVTTIIDIATRPLKGHDFDFGKAAISRDLRNYIATNPLKIRGVKPPKESVQFYRAVGGLSQNLENLGARGDYKAVYAQMLELTARRS